MVHQSCKSSTAGIVYQAYDTVESGWAASRSGTQGNEFAADSGSNLTKSQTKMDIP
ncbi:unnamed protein product [Penicillium roqueforti FM164]|uniref:Uncharacterized protein n=1 Tax=Penicillium roqueforti (strain FM164) TaxID=1365484 RepID=W6QQQ2_PENRF|nr:unnamed protein product [Penicillium roqueforti FM164]